MVNSSLPVDLRRAAVTVSDAVAELTTVTRTLLASWSAAQWSGSAATAAGHGLMEAADVVATARERVHDVAVLAGRAAGVAPSRPGSAPGA